MRLLATLPAVLTVAAWAFSEDAPPSPFAPAAKAIDGRWGSVLLIGGEKKEETLTGKISFTSGKVIQMHDVNKKDVVEVKSGEIISVEAVVEKESIEEEWTWKEMGNDEKIKTGRTYPDREYLFTVTLADGKKVQGHIVGTPVFVTGADGKRQKVVLRTNQRGDFGAKLEDLIYVSRIAFHDEGTPPPWPVKKAEKPKDDVKKEPVEQRPVEEAQPPEKTPAEVK
jgi:hypothetical protein